MFSVIGWCWYAYAWELALAQLWQLCGRWVKCNIDVRCCKLLQVVMYSGGRFAATRLLGLLLSLLRSVPHQFLRLENVDHVLQHRLV